MVIPDVWKFLQEGTRVNQCICSLESSFSSPSIAQLSFGKCIIVSYWHDTYLLRPWQPCRHKFENITSNTDYHCTMALGSIETVMNSIGPQSQLHSFMLWMNKWQFLLLLEDLLTSEKGDDLCSFEHAVSCMITMILFPMRCNGISLWWHPAPVSVIISSTMSHGTLFPLLAGWFWRMWMPSWFLNMAHHISDSFVKDRQTTRMRLWNSHSIYRVQWLLSWWVICFYSYCYVELVLPLFLPPHYCLYTF